MGPALPSGDRPPDGPATTQRILYPVFTDLADETFETARQIAAGVDGHLVVLDLVGTDQPVPSETREVAETMLEARLEGLDQVDSSYHVEQTPTPASRLTEYARRHGISLVVFDENYPRSVADLVRGPVPIRVSNQVPTDVVTVTDGQPLRRAASILVGLAGGPHAKLGVRVGGAVAIETDAALDLFHVSTPGRDERNADVEELFRQARQQLPESVDVETWALPSPDVTQAILNQSDHYDLTILGESQRGQIQRLLRGSRTSIVRTEARNRVITVRSAGTGGFEL